jgi:hypothetical protein
MNPPAAGRFNERSKMMSEVGRPHRLRQAYGDRREMEAKKNKKLKSGIRNMIMLDVLFRLPTSVFRPFLKVLYSSYFTPFLVQLLWNDAFHFCMNVNMQPYALEWTLT